MSFMKIKFRKLFSVATNFERRITVEQVSCKNISGNIRYITTKFGHNVHNSSKNYMSRIKKIRFVIKLLNLPKFKPVIENWCLIDFWYINPSNECWIYKNI